MGTIRRAPRITKQKPWPATPPVNNWALRLYVAGQTPKSIAAFNNLQRICEEELGGKYHIEVIDLTKNPHLAREHQILAVPTVVRKLPLPVRSIIGTLSNMESVLVGLEIIGDTVRPSKKKRDAEPVASSA